MDEKQVQMLQMQQKMDEKQEQMLQMQKQALDRLAVIQSRVQAVLTQTYELHEYPIPRLFIVLPKASRHQDKLLNPFSEQFRLYFLCECGSHTMSEGTKIPHEIHLAKHEGYDLSRPNEFFEKYGSYVLTLMQMIKYGITIAGVIVPSLAHFKIAEGVEAVEGRLKFVKENLGSLVDSTINFIEDQQQNNKSGVDAAEEQTRVDELDVLEGADLRQLESYLKVQDEGRALGNLYRIVTEEGHVKWVCIDHYRENYRESAVQQLRDVVEVNFGTFIEEQGKVKINLMSAPQAKQFYEALVKARRIHELTVKLWWEMTLEDHRKLRAAITNANVACLKMKRFSSKKPTLDFINRNRRFDPIMELLSDGRLQAVTLQGSEDFFSRISSSSIRPAPRLRILYMQPIHLEDAASRTTFVRLLQNCPNLTKLQLGTKELGTIFDTVMHNIEHLPNLKVLELRSPKDHIIIDLLKSEVQGAWAELSNSWTYDPLHQLFLRKGLLTRLTITSAAIDQAKELLPEILCRNPRLLEIKLSCPCARFLDMLDLIISARKRGRAKGYVYAPLRLDFATHFGGTADDRIISSVHLSKESDVVDMSTDIKLGDGWRPDQDYLSSLINRYGWSINILNALSGILSDDIAQQLDKSTEEKGSRITTLMLDAYNLSFVGLECMARVMDRSSYLQEFQLHLQNTLVDDAVENRLLHRHKEALTVLRTPVASDDSHIPWLAKTLSRHDVRRLKILHFMACYSKAIFPQEYVPWLAAMVSSPNDPSVQKSPLPQSLENPQVLPSAEAAADTPTAWEPLQMFGLSGFSLEPEDWKAIIEALDFSRLKRLYVSRSNFSIEQFKTLVDCIPDDSSDVPLEHFYFYGSTLSKQIMSSEMQQQRKTLCEKVPQIKLFFG
ncbi:hypothetical protein BC939DRAFT_503261 [Gamsiella multidivaricata]|uniref:uncharacterized protein n=1 Tax=Gamsiella multidivaricata TaxID=101098 RepID=UPI0022211CFE|nr:uncharacterized protein BC939DRAFT_503261 [Gamsiella multidivaricata]KAI7823329.1 hypothetical protein BC939DRAFT_503261 [Gamsiella multidivaricata]